jgi:molecular chaperone IbpA
MGNLSTNQELSRLFDHFNQVAVGFGPMFRDFNHQTSNYPPHNIVSVSDNEFFLELAVAGFKKGEVTIQEENGTLTITADKEKQESVSDAASYQYRGIAKRSFSKSFRIAENFEIQEAGMEDGILTVRFVKNVPLAKPKMIAIK